MSTIRLEHALLEDGVADDVLLEVEDGRINSVDFTGNPWRCRVMHRPNQPGIPG